MNVQSISTKELREQLPSIRAGLGRGTQYLLIYRSKVIARLEPVQAQPVAGSRIRGGSLRLQANSRRELTPEYLKQLSSSRYA